MRYIVVLSLVLLLATSAQSQGTACIACGLLLTLFQQLANPDAPTGENPDVTCVSLGICNGTCPLFPNNTWPAQSPVIVTDGGVIDQRRRQLAAQRVRGAGRVFDFLVALQGEEARRGRPLSFSQMWTYSMRFLALGPCDDGFNITCDIDRVFNHHLPLADGDGDNFAATTPELLSNSFRGADWRGRDCNDTNGSVYPGRLASAGDALVDSNCNGIVGGNASGTYETMFCSGPNAPMGIAILGDSAAAHFHLPQQYVNARAFNLSGVLELASNEADWPACSWATGFRDTGDCPTSFGVPMASIYQRMWALNRCMHRDFQNMGVNGARVGSMAPPGIINGLARRGGSDAPLLVFFALIGNDVCDGHPGNGSWTTVPEFTASVLSSLAYLDSGVLPNGSHVAFMPLVDGRVLYDTMHNLTHPLGITYAQLYDVLACNGVTPCWGWLNSDPAWRAATSKRAAELSAVYNNITESMTFNHFDTYVLNVNWTALIAQYVQAGGVAADLIEPVDGFHPSQAGHQLLAATVWDDLVAHRPAWLPAVNPFNAQIEALFGDQGGWG